MVHRTSKTALFLLLGKLTKKQMLKFPLSPPFAHHLVAYPTRGSAILFSGC